MVDQPARYCEGCGQELSAEGRFCPNCGRPVHQTASVPTPEADVSVPPPPGDGNAAVTQATPQGSRRRGLSNPYTLGCLGLVGLFLFASVVAAMIGSARDDGGGQAAQKPQQQAQKKPAQKVEDKDAKQVQDEQPEPEHKASKPAPKPEPKPEPQEPSFASFGDGAYQVGTDVQPGIYRTRENSPNCYWERLRNFSGGINGILANGGTGAPAIVAILPTDVGFNSDGCGTWTKDLSAITDSKISFGAGAFIVGTDMEPGTYRNSGGNNCYWERLRGFNGGMSAIIANGGSSNPSIVTIAATDAGFQSDGCGTWTKLE